MVSDRQSDKISRRDRFVLDYITKNGILAIAQPARFCPSARFEVARLDNRIILLGSSAITPHLVKVRSHLSLSPVAKRDELTYNINETFHTKKVGYNMTQLSSKRTARLGRLFPDRQLSPEEKAHRKAEDEVLYRRCRAIFDRVQPELIKEHYDWFIVIEPDSGDYFIDPDKTVARQKAREKHPGKMRLVARINETGTCGRI